MLNRNQLKLIAVLAMVLDHWAALFLEDPCLWNDALRLVGRLAAPIMCFFVAEGYYHTSDVKRYMQRLLLMGILSHIPYNLCFEQDLWAFWRSTDIGFSLLLGLVSLAVWKNERIPLPGKIIALAVCCLMAYPADWNYIAVLWVWGFGVFHQRRAVQFSFFSIVAALYCFQPYLYGLNFSPVRIGVVLVLPLLWLYNGEAGHKNKAIQWGYYWFYPLHLLLLHGLQTVL